MGMSRWNYKSSKYYSVYRTIWLYFCKASYWYSLYWSDIAVDSHPAEAEGKA